MNSHIWSGGNSQPFKILFFDGDGVHGLIGLFILKHILEHIQKSNGQPETLKKPCEIFDFISGTGTGGIIAIMLGRLGMSVDASIEAYRKIAKVAFTVEPNNAGSQQNILLANKLKNAFDEMIQENCNDIGCKNQRMLGINTAHSCRCADIPFFNESCVKTVVLAVSKDSIGKPLTLFRTYDISASFSNCKIWEVARATLAANPFFEPIKVDLDKVEFANASFSHNNPCEALIKEAKLHVSGRTEVILNIGMGLEDSIETRERSPLVKALAKIVAVCKILRIVRVLGDFIETRGKSPLVKALAKIVAMCKILRIVRVLGVFIEIRGRSPLLIALAKLAVMSKNAHLRLKVQNMHNRHFRFSIPDSPNYVTVSDWDKFDLTSAQTKTYIEKKENDVKMFISAITNNASKACATPIKEDYNSHIHDIPFYENLNFVGRNDDLSFLHGIFTQPSPRQLALVGLGGIGKTQIALQFAHAVTKDRPQYSVFWLTAANMDTFEQACNRVAQSLNIGIADNEDPKMQLKQYLESLRTDWLLVLDNVDDPETFEMENGICHFLPQSEKGRLIFTTRSLQVAQLATQADENIKTVGEMPPEDLTAILGFDSQKPNSTEEQDQGLIPELLKELCHLPLAVSQAADYIRMNGISVSEYLCLFRNTEKDKFELLEKVHRDAAHHHPSQGAVATTWLITVQQIQNSSPPATILLQFLAYIHWASIPESILPHVGTRRDMIDGIEVLLGYGFLREQKPKADTKKDMMDGTEMLPGHGLFRKQKTEDTMFDMHRLVHLVIQPWLEEKLRQAPNLRQDFTSHIASVLPDKKWKVGCTPGKYLPHALYVFNKERSNSTGPYKLAFKIGKCLLRGLEIIEAINVFEYIVEGLKDNSLLQQDSQHELARAYARSHQFEEAISIQESLVDLRKRLYDIDDPLLLKSQHQLANICCLADQVEKGIEILEKVVSVQEIIVPIGDRSLLLSQRDLAQAYCKNSRFGDAILLLEGVVEMGEKQLPTDHHALVSYQCELLQLYTLDFQIDKRISTIERIVAAKERTLLADNPSLVSSQDELIKEYIENGLLKKRLSMLQNVVGMRGKVLPANSCLALKSRDDLASAFLDNGEPRKAIKILGQVVKMKESTPTPDEPSILRSKMQLANSYYADGQADTATQCLREAVKAGRISLSKDNQDLVDAEKLYKQWISP